MHISATYAGKLIHHCGGDDRGCGGAILKGEQIMRGVWYYRKFRNQINWHFQCYYDQAKAYLEANPFVDSHKGGDGRPKLDLTLAQRKRRKSLQVQASVIRRKMKESVSMKLPGWNDRLKILNTRYNGLADEIKEIGGVPRKWYG